jgi:hypothetical protein
MIMASFDLALRAKNAVRGSLAALNFDNFKNKILQSCDLL